MIVNEKAFNASEFSEAYKKLWMLRPLVKLDS